MGEYVFEEMCKQNSRGEEKGKARQLGTADRFQSALGQIDEK